MNGIEWTVFPATIIRTKCVTAGVDLCKRNIGSQHWRQQITPELIDENVPNAINLVYIETCTSQERSGVICALSSILFSCSGFVDV
jgi:hypothetical protein